MHPIPGFVLRIVLAAVPALAGVTIAMAQTGPGDRHVTASLVGETRNVVPGQPLHVALRQQIAPGWHTYWRNPGESGLPTTIDWSLPPGFTAGPIQWPTPERFVVDPVVGYGYHDDRAATGRHHGAAKPAAGHHGDVVGPRQLARLFGHLHSGRRRAAHRAAGWLRAGTRPGHGRCFRGGPGPDAVRQSVPHHGGRCQG